jgi:uncharacterized protein YkwD
MRFAAFLVALAAATAVAAPTVDVKPRDLIDDDAPHQDDADFISAVMRAHWYWRRLHCAQDLVWDPELAKQARADVAKCPDKPTHVSLRSQNHAGCILTAVGAPRQQPLVRETCSQGSR